MYITSHKKRINRWVDYRRVSEVELPEHSSVCVWENCDIASSCTCTVEIKIPQIVVFLKSPDSLNQSQLPSPQSCNTLSLISCTPGISNQFLCLLEVRKKWDSTVLNYCYYWDAAKRLLLPSK